MRSLGRYIKAAIKAKIDGLGYNVYANYVPASEQDTHILISDVTDTDQSTMQTSDTEHTIQVAIYSKENIANSGAIVDQLADDVMQAIYPTPDATLDIDEAQSLGIALQGVAEQTIQLNSFIVYNKILTFRLNYFIQ